MLSQADRQQKGDEMNAFRACVFVAVLTGVFCLVTAAQETDTKQDAEFPPRVVKTEPADRTADVDFRLREIKVTFDRPMETGKNYSWIILRAHGVYPGYRGGPEPRWENDGKTCVLPVRLSPNTLYAVGINSYRHTGFHDPAGKPAVPFAWVFKTTK